MEASAIRFVLFPNHMEFQEWKRKSLDLIFKKGIFTVK